jgi:ATP-binding cassette subfamily B multidrug efflux pump
MSETQRGSGIGALARLNRYFWKYRWRFSLGILFVTISNLYAIVPPKLVRVTFDFLGDLKPVFHHFKDSESEESLFGLLAIAFIWFGAVVVLSALLKGVFMFLMRQTIVVMSRHVEFDMKNEIYDHYQRLSLGFFKRNKTGDLMARITEDVSQVRMYLGPAILYAVNLVVLTVLVIYNMFRVSPTLTAYVLIPLPILSVTIYYVSQRINIKSTQVQRQLSAMSSFVQEAFSGIRVLKAYSKEKQWGASFAKETNRYKDISLELVRIQATFFPTMLVLIGLSTILTVYVGGMQVMAGEISTGNIAEFIIYINMLTWPVAALGWITSIIQRASASQARINEFLDTVPEIVNTAKQMVPIKGGIAFRHVRFVYPDSGAVALDDVSFEVNAGQSLAIIGRTGSGKSSIAALLTRAYDATEGAVLLDGVPIRDLHLDAVRSGMGYVPQDVFLFSDSIANNIAFGLKEDTYSMDDVKRAAQQADIHDNIMEFDHAYETRVGERGITLSGGQKQRISIARAIIRHPQVLIFDDCLSAVDTQTEEKILTELRLLMQGRTTILISHRVSTVKHADQIMVMDHGRILEKGTHDELLAAEGAYFSLFQQQMLEDSRADKV